MIAWLQGKVVQKGPTALIVNCQGVGYEVRVSLHTASALDGREEITLHVYHHFSQDTQTLFGFVTLAERQLFIQLISVSGVGPGTAQLILSYMTPEETERAILSEDLMAFRKVKGVGEKTARRILVDLKDKIVRSSGELADIIPVSSNRAEEEALFGLLALGFARAQAQKALGKVSAIHGPALKPEELIRHALRELA